MPLTWDVGSIENWQHVTTAPWTRDAEQQEWHPVTQYLLWSALSCGWSEITEKNAEEIATRIRIEAEVFGAYSKPPRCRSMADGTRVCPTLADVRMHIGMRVNASPKTRAQWFRGVWHRACADTGEQHLSMYERFERQEQDRLGVSNIGSVAA